MEGQLVVLGMLLFLSYGIFFTRVFESEVMGVITSAIFVATFVFLMTITGASIWTPIIFGTTVVGSGIAYVIFSYKKKTAKSDTL